MRSQTAGCPSFELIDRAFHLLRNAGPNSLLIWSVGTAPGVVGLLFFWLDMSNSPFATEHVLEASLAMALLYAWMKTWQATFASRLLAFALGRAATPLGLRGWLRSAAKQTRWQSTSFLVLPLAVVVALPLAWVYAFYQNLTVTGTVSRAWHQAMLWPRQNHVVLAVLLLFSLFVFGNLLIAIIMAPWLLSSLLGVETAMSRSPMSLFNATTLVAAVALAYFMLGPLVKAVYVLRCLDGDAIRSGEDLLADLSELEEALSE